MADIITMTFDKWMKKGEQNCSEKIEKIGVLNVLLVATPRQ